MQTLSERSGERTNYDYDEYSDADQYHDLLLQRTKNEILTYTAVREEINVALFLQR